MEFLNDSPPNPLEELRKVHLAVSGLVKRVRLRCLLTQAEMARALQIPESTIAAIETGRMVLPDEAFEKLVHFLRQKQRVYEQYIRYVKGGEQDATENTPTA